MEFSVPLLRRLCLLFAAANVCLYSSSAIAAEKVVLTYGILRQSVPVEDLTTFAETGEMSSGLNFLFKATKQNPERVREVLTEPVDVNVVTLSRALNNPMGELILDRIGEVVRTPDDRANRQALRAALVESASSDNRVSLIEVMQNYPTSEIVVEGKGLARVYRQISDPLRRIQSVVEDLGI
ncbi:alpha/beta hydrolase [Merismopedia glauca]|uniref:DUF1400 domain-containing protein n=2 Tax=Merismopedia TaxID=53402 RepID=A0A2T1C6E9_9CYAN|nr:hypothetical protein C7B64_06820 [Merismopedia glauca CCAP 1448/3]